MGDGPACASDFHRNLLMIRVAHRLTYASITIYYHENTGGLSPQLCRHRFNAASSIPVARTRGYMNRQVSA
jgi:hypothetical protein